MGDLSIPSIARAKGDARINIDRLRTMNVGRTDGAPVPLLQVAQLQRAPQFARTKRLDLERVVTISAAHATDTAAEFAARLAPEIARTEPRCPPATRTEPGAGLEASRDPKGNLAPTSRWGPTAVWWGLTGSSTISSAPR